MSRKKTSNKKEELKTYLAHYIAHLQDPTIINLLYSKYLEFINRIYEKSKEMFLKKGYCGTFMFPYQDFENLLKKIGIDTHEIKELGRILFAIDKDELDVKNTMYGDTFYVFNSLLIAALGDLLRKEGEKLDSVTKRKLLTLIQYALFMIQAKLWNGRLKTYVKYCNPTIMKCAIDKMNASAYVKKYSDPFEMITKQFVPTIFKKYIMGYIESGNLYYISQAFKQSWNRLNQLFMSSPRPGSNNRLGLAVKYYEVYRSGECKTSQQAKDAETAATLIKTEHELIFELTEKIKEYILFNSDETLPPKIKMLISNRTNINKKLIDRIPHIIKSHEVEQSLGEIISFIVKKFEIHSDRSQVCSDLFLIYVDKLMSSKNNAEVNQLKEELRNIASKLVTNFDSLSRPTQLSVMRAILLTIAYYISEYICYHYTPGE